VESRGQTNNPAINIEKSALVISGKKINYLSVPGIFLLGENDEATEYVFLANGRMSIVSVHSSFRRLESARHLGRHMERQSRGLCSIQEEPLSQ